MSGRFKLDPAKLYELIDPKNPALVQELGGVEAIAAALRSDCVNGLAAEELDKVADRRGLYVALAFFCLSAPARLKWCVVQLW